MTDRLRAGALLSAAIILAWTTVARGAGPLLVNGAGTPLVWTTRPIPFNPDRGPLGSLDNAAAVALVSSSFAVWGAVPTASLQFANAGVLPVDVTVANWSRYLGSCDGLSEIIFDSDGRITDALFGAGASNEILGFAGPECGSPSTATITEGSALLNGKWLDGVTSATNPEMSLAAFQGVFVHEFGHYLDLDHSQVNLVEAFDGDPGNDDAVAAMFPFAVKGDAAATLHLDDRVSVSTLYPAPSFATGYARLVGTVWRPDGATPFQGAHVVARRVGDPRRDAVGAVSGARYAPTAEGGPPPASLQGLYEIPGLPAGDYTIEVEEVSRLFSGGSSVGPLDPPARLPGVPEFYNAPREAGTDPPDAPEDAVTVGAAAGTTVPGLDVVINGFTPPPHDACGAARAIPSIPFTDRVDTLGASTSPGDPAQSCSFGGPRRNANSVWYLLTTSETAVVTIDTLGSTYDTVLTAYSGSCDTPIEIECNDDWGGRLDSRITVRVGPESPVLLEVTSGGSAGGGTLVLNARPAFDCTPYPFPASACAEATRSNARLLASPIAAKNKADWKWSTKPGGSAAAFGDPTDMTDYAFCLYDAVSGVATLKLNAVVPAGGICGGRDCWRRAGTGFRYRDSVMTPNGIRQVLVKTKLGGSESVKVQARGSHLETPQLPLAEQDRVIVQLRNSNGHCWSAQYPSPGARNDTTGFSAACVSLGCQAGVSTTTSSPSTTTTSSTSTTSSTTTDTTTSTTESETTTTTTSP